MFDVIVRLGRSLMKQGISVTVLKFNMWLQDYWFDVRYRTNTSGIIPPDRLTIKGKKIYGRYQPTKVVPLRRVFSDVKPVIPLNSVLVDFGCGKGRAMIIAAEFGFRTVRGVEYAHELVDVAIDNCERYKKITNVQTEFRVFEKDASEYVIQPDENVFFLSNPFGATIMAKVLGNIKRSIEQHPRTVFLVYYLPRQVQTIEQETDFTMLREWRMLGYDFVVYSNAELEKDIRNQNHAVGKEITGQAPSLSQSN